MTLPPKMEIITTALAGARSASPVRPWPTVHPVAIEAPIPRPSPPMNRFNRSGGPGALSLNGPDRDKSRRAPIGSNRDRGLQPRAKPGEGAGVRARGSEPHPDDGQQGPNIAGSQLVPDPRRAASSPVHRKSEKKAASDGRHGHQGKLCRLREIRRENSGQHEKLNGDSQPKNLEPCPVAFQHVPESGVQAEGTALGSISEGRADRQCPDHRRIIHGDSPFATGNPCARHSATPSPRERAR